MELTDTERAQYKTWMQQAAAAAHGYSGSETSERALFEPMLAMDAFVRSKNANIPSVDLEQIIAQEAWPDSPVGLQNFNSFLDAAAEAYTRKLREANDYEHVLSIIAAGGTAIKRYGATFVQTNDGELQAATTAAPEPVKAQTQPRLAMVIQHLKSEGIYTDDIVAHVCTPDSSMIRKLPYIVLHIPRLDKEIAVCDEVGEITFVANKSLGTDVWTHLSKNQLKVRPEITAVRFGNEEEWWSGIRQVLMGERSQPGPKVDVQVVAGKKPPLDVALIKQSILAHHQATGEWPWQKIGDVQYGPYAGKTNWARIDRALRVGHLGLSGGSSLAIVNAEVSTEYKLDYVNLKKQESFALDAIRQSILEHRQAMDAWPNRTSGMVKYGPYAEKTEWRTIDGALKRGGRGLAGGSSLATLNEEVSKAHGLDYENHLKQEPFTLDGIKQSILVHRQATEEWPNDKSGRVKYGPYATKTFWHIIDTALRIGIRGLSGGSSLAALSEEISKQHGLYYVNRKKQEPFTVDAIKQSIHAHHQATGQWPSRRSGKVKYGPCAGKATWGAIEHALYDGGRGLEGGSSLAILNEEVARKHEMTYIRNRKGSYAARIERELSEKKNWVRGE